MLGTKAETLSDWAAANGRAFLRHDYSGHGESGGAFADGTISKWLGESLAVFRRFTEGQQILVGSSMGAWIALRMVQELRKAGDSDRIAGLVLLAPAPDFTAELIEPALTKAQKRDLAEKGYFEEPSDYSAEPNIYTRALIEDGRGNRVMTGPIDTHCPVHILQGMADPDVPHKPCAEAGQPAAGRRRDAVADPRRRPPPVAAAGPRHAAARRRGDMVAAGGLRHECAFPSRFPPLSRPSSASAARWR